MDELTRLTLRVIALENAKPNPDILSGLEKEIVALKTRIVALETALNVLRAAVNTNLAQKSSSILAKQDIGIAPYPKDLIETKLDKSKWFWE